MGKAREMDLIVTGIDLNEAHDYGVGVVWYGFPVGDHGLVNWKIPHGSKFDLSRIEVGKRYSVKSVELDMGSYYDPIRKRMVDVRRFEWVDAKELSPRAKSTTLTHKQSEQSRELAKKPLADNGDLFTWTTNKK